VDKTAAARWQCIGKITEPKFERYISKTRARPDGEITTAELLRLYGNEVRYRERIANLSRIAKGNTRLRTANRYPVIYADPPWQYEYNRRASGEIENHYPTLDVEEICAVPVRDIATPDAVLFLWSPSPKLAAAMEVIDAWGFTQRTSMVWVKDVPGLGYYARQRHEFLLIATRGHPPPPPPAARPDSVIEAPRGQHSAKPEIVIAIIERMFPDLPRIELFCRGRARLGWNAWGNEVEGDRGRVAGDASADSARRGRRR
jgi:N6-adenosine-specific RNA methylase IME4